MTQYSPDDLYRHRVLGALEGSTAHSQLVFKVTRAIRNEERNRSRVYGIDIRTTDRARPLTVDTSSARSPKLDPAGQRMAFLSSRGDAGMQVQLLRLDGGEARRLTSADKALSSIEDWSPDGRRILLTAECDRSERPDEGDRSARERTREAGKDDDAPQVATFLPYKRDGSGIVVGKRVELLEADAETGDIRTLVAGDFDVNIARWSPEGNRLAFTRGRGGRERHWKDLWIANADGQHARRRTQSLASVQKIAWSPDGRRIALIAAAAEGGARAQLWMLEADGHAPPELLGGDDFELASASGLVWHPDGERVAVVAVHRGVQPIAVVDVTRNDVRLLPHGLRQAFGVAACGDRLVYVSTSMRWPDELYSVGWDGGDVRRLTSFNRRWVRERPQPRVRKRRFRVPDGRGGEERIDAWLLLPAQGKPPYPLLVDIHGGPQSAVLADFAMHTAWYPLLSRGWAVLSPNPVGSSGYGAVFAERICGHWGELDFPQVEAILDTLQKERFADERLAITGKSYGGYLSAWAIGHTQRFKAAIVSAPVSNILSHAGTSDTGYYVAPYTMCGEMDEVAERAYALSPVAHCAKATTPTLILQGEKDGRCPLGQSEELFANLIRCGKTTAELVVYPGGSHGLAESGKPSHRVDYHQRLCDWANRWTLDQQTCGKDEARGATPRAA